MSIFEHLEQLIEYGLERKLISIWDQEYTRNRLYEALDIKHPQTVSSTPIKQSQRLPDLLSPIYEWAAETGRIEANTDTYRDLLSAKLMGCFVPPPSEVIRKFEETKALYGPKQATKEFYQYAEDVYYIRSDRIAKNVHWTVPTEYGELEITINLSKPEKDPKAIAAAKEQMQTNYPPCVLCKENVGFEGSVNHPARQNHRIIPVILRDEQWYLQFSPYVYYPEHCIVLKGEHEPMEISKKTFERLLSFLGQYPHYFIGSNADLPIVGGSILSHDHFQGGAHDFPMARAEMEERYELMGHPGVSLGLVKWPMSVLRLQGDDPDRVADAANHIFRAWQQYSDEKAGIAAFTGDTPHNTVTPIARRRGGSYELDIVLRNNRTDEEHPLGIFHPHQEVHHIKKENIGLIEVMGLAILPGRLQEEMKATEAAMCSADPKTALEDNELTAKHKDWALRLMERRTITKGNAEQVIKEELGHVFARILEHAGVFKQTPEGKQAFNRFIHSLGAKQGKSLNR
ncbi:UDP-glucose--hexose-1-phosphate uridylyltransferase [Bacillus mojavensis]|uniref:UDP-glucose--hexose-1-phosphate uridylyltransferase n=1 Tax=Bacillus mojavensis TaxID=72360 RepID=UPI0002884420|nr:UDP-glucose--hexose-1-phosphate uridylyltransferase [Bacillus mojavensis]MDR4228544.1 UDP-glucose--hexose-1-phosphate uridylyltransferase [Bacillus mojavensis]MEC3586756.1 UDP-glucose--hexose-1-phosphate uridylyltransferase [Bacillus mojavensis]MEC5241946.1 UDP-glucose--hexose-1-phosphate uridylyltransferase [Bacillus mojavensis]MED0749069.1 UDP-glucose--hexose-1-phosphate uridylyltransferase [Bacillus mojavensis]